MYSYKKHNGNTPLTCVPEKVWSGIGRFIENDRNLRYKACSLLTGLPKHERYLLFEGPVGLSDDIIDCFKKGYCKITVESLASEFEKDLSRNDSGAGKAATALYLFLDDLNNPEFNKQTKAE